MDPVTDPDNPGSRFMSDAEFDAAIAEIDEAITAGRVRMRFWVCPENTHRRPGELVVTVEWRGDVAHCTFPGCGRTSADGRGDDDATQNRPAEAGESQA